MIILSPCLYQPSAVAYLSCLDSSIAFESTWAPDLATCSPGNFWQHKTQGPIWGLSNEIGNCKCQLGLGKWSATGLGHFRPLFPKQIISVCETWARSDARRQCVTYGLCPNVILQAQPYHAPLTNRRWTVSIRCWLNKLQLLHFGSFLFFKKSTMSALLPLSYNRSHSIFPPPFLLKHSETVRHLIDQTLQSSLRAQEGWGAFLISFCNSFGKLGVVMAQTICYTWNTLPKVERRVKQRETPAIIIFSFFCYSCSLDSQPKDHVLREKAVSTSQPKGELSHEAESKGNASKPLAWQS